MRGLTLGEGSAPGICVRRTEPSEPWCVLVGQTAVPVKYDYIGVLEEYETALARRASGDMTFMSQFDTMGPKGVMALLPEAATSRLMDVINQGWPFDHFSVSKDGELVVEDEPPEGDDRALVLCTIGAPDERSIKYLSSDHDSAVVEDRKYGGLRVVKINRDFPSPGIQVIEQSFDSSGVPVALISMLKGASFRVLRNVEKGEKLWKEATVSWHWVSAYERKREHERACRDRQQVKPAKKDPGLDLVVRPHY